MVLIATSIRRVLPLIVDQLGESIYVGGGTSHENFDGLEHIMPGGIQRRLPTSSPILRSFHEGGSISTKPTTLMRN